MTGIHTLMTGLGLVLSWSRAYCGWVCGALVPACLLITLQVLIFTVLQHPHRRVVAGVSLVWVGLLEVHVWSWFWVGVVQIPTFVLIGLGLLCVLLVIWAMAFPGPLQRLGRWAKRWQMRRIRNCPSMGGSHNGEAGGVAV
jgi:hypothetical protein